MVKPGQQPDRPKPLCRRLRIYIANKQAKADSRAYISRLADDSLVPEYRGIRRSMNRRRYGAWELIQAVKLSREHSVAKASRMTGIPAGTIHCYRYRSALPKTGKNCLKNCLKALQLARVIQRTKKTVSGERYSACGALYRAADQLKMSVASVKVFMTTEAFPALPGFIIYADPTVQARAEQIAAGRVIGGRIHDA